MNPGSMTANIAPDTLMLVHATPPGLRDDRPTHSETPPRRQGTLPDHEPTQAEQEKLDMPDLSLKQVRECLFRPIRFEWHKEP